ncbi:MAG: pilin [Candidatus Pacebacteria bacterium]|nr:pilin [Candidatus Paceibacterota bacterium]MDD5445854.1 pilin [Candidatus Paceibacterota bacterium]
MKTFKNFTLIILIIVFTIPYFSFARNLELSYPTIGGLSPQNTSFPISNYVSYIFSFVIYIAGIIALLALTVAGVNYLISMGNPGKIKEAKEKVLKVFFGVLIIFASFLLLRTISPSFVQLDFEELDPINPIIIEPIEPPVIEYGDFKYSPETADLLKRIDTLAREIKIESAKARKIAYDLRDTADFCDCSRGQGICGDSSY